MESVRQGSTPALQLLVAVCLLPGPHNGGAPHVSDSQLVYCLSPANQPALVQAAIALGPAKAVPGRSTRLADGGHPLTVAQWRTKAPGDFARACSALTGAAALPNGGSGGGGSAWLTTLTTLATFALGMLATFIGQLTDQYVGRRRELRDAIPDAYAAFAVSVETYLDNWQENSGDHSEVLRRRTEFILTLQRLPSRRRRRAVSQQVIEGLPLADPLSTSVDTASGHPRALTPDERAQRVQGVRAQMRQVEGLKLKLLGDRRGERAPVPAAATQPAVPGGES